MVKLCRMCTTEQRKVPELMREKTIGVIAESGYQARFVKRHPWDNTPDDEQRMNPLYPYWDGKKMVNPDPHQKRSV